MSLERRKILTHLGAELELTPARRRHGRRHRPRGRARQERCRTPSSPASSTTPPIRLCMSSTTAEEIWNDTGGNVDAIVIGVGTGGTLTGVGRVLKPRNPSLKIIAVEPAASPVLSERHKGARTRSRASAPASCRPSSTPVADRRSHYGVERHGVRDARSCSPSMEGIPGGISTGANVAAAISVAARPEFAGKTVVTFAPSRRTAISRPTCSPRPRREPRNNGPRYHRTREGAPIGSFRVFRLRRQRQKSLSTQSVGQWCRNMRLSVASCAFCSFSS